MNLEKFWKALNTWLYAIFIGEKPVHPDDPKPPPPPPPVVHSTDFRGGTLAERKEMYQLAITVGKEQGLDKLKSRILPTTHTMLDDMLATIEGESGFNRWCVNFRSKDYGLCQFSERYYLKEYKMTPQEAIDNPRKCLEIMATNFKVGRHRNWIAFDYAKERLTLNTLKIYA